MNLAQLSSGTPPLPRYNKNVYVLSRGQAVQLVERHRIHKGHKLGSECDGLCFLSKNLDSAANCRDRQDFLAGRATDAKLVYCVLKESPDCKALPAQVAQRALKLVLTAWHSYRAAIKAYKGNPSAFSGLPEIAGDKGTKENRSDGSYAVLYKNQAFSKRALKKRRVDPSRTHFYQRTEVSQRALIRIVTEVGFYVIEIAGVQPPEPRRPEGGNYAAADQGLNNLATSAHSKSERTAQESELRGDCLGVGRVGSLMRIEMPPII